MSSRSAFIREQNNTMPGSSRTQQRVEALYNVVTEYPQYDLHFAAASGNLGLVAYAISNGQPVNSVLNGVLPLHAACAGGSEVVVDYLIKQGADVNAPRLPRRYVSELHGHGHGIGPGARKREGIALGASGSTPLHFAAANGHLGIIKLLLQNGAVPDRADKHGVTPEMLAREHGWLECAALLSEWAGGRRDDLPPIAGTGIGSGSGSGSGTSASKDFESIVEPEPEECTRILHMKRSIDNALGLFKSSSGSNRLQHHASHGQLHLPSSPARSTPPRPVFSHSNSGSNSTNPPPSPGFSKPFGEYTFYASPTSTLAPEQEVPAHRRPSLPHLFHSTSNHETVAPPPRRQASMSAAGSGYVYGRNDRPRSAGTDAEQSKNVLDEASAPGSLGSAGMGAPATITTTTTTTPRKLGSKISLRNLFRRANTEGPGSASPSPVPGPTPVGDADTAMFVTSMTASPGPIPIPVPTPINTTRDVVRSSSSSPPSRPSLGPGPLYRARQMRTAISTGVRTSTSLTPPASPVTASGPATGGTPGTWYRARMGSETGVPSPLGQSPTAVELHHRYSIEHLRERYRERELTSSDASSPVFENDEAPSIGGVGAVGVPRPSILLRGHNRSSSNQSQGQTHSPSPSPATHPGLGSRMLRFDSASSMSPSSSFRTPGLLQRRLRGSSISSLGRADDQENLVSQNDLAMPDSAPANTMRFEESAEADLDGEGENAETKKPAGDLFSRPRVNGAGGMGGRPRGTSFASSASSVSPGSSASYALVDYPSGMGPIPLSPGSTSASASATTTAEKSPLSPNSGILTTVSTAQDELEKTAMLSRVNGERGRKEPRGRGMSISSMDTEESANAILSQSSSGFTSITLPSPQTVPSPSSALIEQFSNDPEEKVTGSMYKLDSLPSSSEDLGEPIAQSFSILRNVANGVSPLDLRGISNLAEAEALVKQAQREILEAASLSEDDPNSPGIPLSAQLLAYGELLAVEKRFVMGERQRLREQRAERSDEEDGAKETVKGMREEYGVSGKMREEYGVSGKMRVGGTQRMRVSARNARPPGGVKKSPRERRPHTAEGASRGDWGKTSLDGVGAEESSAKHENATPTRIKHTPSHSVSSPLQNSADVKQAKSLADIRIVETSATPVESPQTPDAAGRNQFASSLKEETKKPAVSPFSHRSRTPDPEIPVDAYTTGVPLVRVATAPLQDSHSDVDLGMIGPDARTGSLVSRRMGGVGGAQKLARMGFSTDTHSPQYHYSPPGSHSSSRSPSKARFGGIKSLVQSLKGKS